jgi:hypothetical protein
MECLGRLKGSEHLEDLGVDGRIKGVEFLD